MLGQLGGREAASSRECLPTPSPEGWTGPYTQSMPLGLRTGTGTSSPGANSPLAHPAFSRLLLSHFIIFKDK